MAAQAARLISEDVGDAEALAAGIRTAFTFGAVISLFAIRAVFFIRRPAAVAPRPEAPEQS
jgi:DHA2 family lincomycin resistance protein-like MFS transporter